MGTAIDDSIDDLKADADYLLQALTILYGKSQSQDSLPVPAHPPGRAFFCVSP